MKPRLRVGVLLLAGTLLSACAPARRGSVSERLVVRVHNDLLPPSALTVYGVSGPGTRRVLGSVSPGGTRSFEYRISLAAPEQQLVAVTAEGREIVSVRFSAATVDEVEWAVRTNQLSFP